MIKEFFEVTLGRSCARVNTLKEAQAKEKDLAIKELSAYKEELSKLQQRKEILEEDLLKLENGIKECIKVINQYTK